MKPSHWLKHNTRSRLFIWKMAIGILALGVAGAWGVDAIRSDTRGAERPSITPPGTIGLFGRESAGPIDPRDWLDPWLGDPATDFADVIDTLAELYLIGLGERFDPSPIQLKAPEIIAAVNRSIKDPTRNQVAVAFVESLDAGAPTDKLTRLAAGDQPAPHANYALGLAGGGVSALQREADLFDSDRARRLVVEHYTAAGDTAWLDRMSSDPDFGPLIGAGVRFQLAYGDRDWLGIFLWHWPAQLEGTHPAYVALGGLTGLIWLAFLLNASGVRNLVNGRVLLCLIALGLGVLSIPVTLFVYTWLDLGLGFSLPHDPGLREGLIYCIAGIGLTEELCKLALLLPLAPILARRGSALEMLIVAGCVGLGFAAEENIGYFADSAGGDAAGRMLTANFAHVVMTGLCGFALCQAFMHPRDRLLDFVIVFVGVVVCHGLYDAFIIVPALAEYNLASAIVYILIVQQFFHELRRYTRLDGRTVSLTATFVGGFCLLIAVTLIAQSWRSGPLPAVNAVIPGALGAAIFMFIFFREIDEPLHP